ncbi:hypothetical protein [Granulicella sp. dw_53]|uniref:hypothetical protein n=1 Tax=Granulicella sp. dw_53 TaxID=2719792 RepID=UPI001BD324AB|nr:hypothetical protein [Granulicella sp. dw_53]
MIDPNDTLTREVNADRAFGTRIGVYHTPTFFVVSEKGCVNVDDPNLIDQTVQAALSQAAAPVRSGPRK